MNLSRLRPTRTTWLALVGFLWSISFDALRDFVWADLRDGLVDLRGMSRSTRLLVWMGFGLLFVMAAVLVFNDFWRAHFPLLAATAGTPGRGSLVPVAVIPVTLYMLALAWSFALAGALHSGVGVRLAVLLGYSIIMVLWLRASLLATSAGWMVALGWAPLAGVLLLFLLRWRRPARPTEEFVALFLLVMAAFGVIQQRLVEMWRVSDAPLFLSILDSNMVSYAGLALPLLLLLGLDIADFVHRAGSWVSGIAGQRLPGWGLYGLLGALSLWWGVTLTEQVGERLAADPLPGVLLAYASALPVPLGALCIWLLVRRWNGAGTRRWDEEAVVAAAHRAAPWFILAFLASNLVLIVLLSVVTALGSEVHVLEEVSQSVDRLYGLYQRNFMSLVLAIALGVGLWMAWRGRWAMGLYLGTLGTILLWGDLTAPGRPLAFLAWQGPEAGFWWVVWFLGLGLYWLVRARLTPDRGARLLLVLVMAALLRQTDFIENPFSPLFSFAGVGFIAFGLIWDALTIGGWANRGSPALPRLSRIFLYLGYVLFTVTLVNWMLTAHNLSYVETFTGDAAISGLNMVGKPLLYALFLVILGQPDEARERDNVTA